MKLPKNYFENLTAKRYREYLKLLPDLQKENTRIITTLILTFSAMSFFGIFAINPTLSTIVTLKKQLSDSMLVHEKLGIKLNNLSSLQQQYSSLSSDLPVVFDAIPQNPQAPNLMGEIIALSQEKKTQLTSLSVSGIQLTGDPNPLNGSSYIFSLQAQGAYDDLINFTKSLAQINRIISIDSISIARDVKPNTLDLNLVGRGYFKK